MNQKNLRHSTSYIEKIIDIRRVAKVVKGGRRFSFSALVVVGDGINHVGFGLGKAKEISEAIRKGRETALKKKIFIHKNNRTIPHKITGKFGSGLVIMLPAVEGTGLIAGATMRAIFEAVGIKDILAKSIRSTNNGNIVRATINGLNKLTVYNNKIILLKTK